MRWEIRTKWSRKPLTNISSVAFLRLKYLNFPEPLIEPETDLKPRLIRLLPSYLTLAGNSIKMFASNANKKLTLLPC